MYYQKGLRLLCRGSRNTDLRECRHRQKQSSRHECEKEEYGFAVFGRFTRDKRTVAKRMRQSRYHLPARQNSKAPANRRDDLPIRKREQKGDSQVKPATHLLILQSLFSLPLPLPSHLFFSLCPLYLGQIRFLVIRFSYTRLISSRFKTISLKHV